MPTLEDAEVAFSQWRALKVSTHERIPQNLMEMARLLVAEHGAIVVSRRLKISPQRFRPKTVAPPGARKFVEVQRLTPDLLSPSVIVVNVKLSLKKELTLTVPATNHSVVSDLLKKILKP